jgi:predicted CxxxxCH...CXXCH cytochrome family protein
MGKNHASKRRYSQMIVGIAALTALMFNAATVRAVSALNSCTTYCHGMPPRDAARKANPHFGSRSSAFLGNHKSHLPAAPAAGDCSICHKPVSATDFGHQNDIVDMANSLKGYSSAALRAKFDKGVFFNQTSIPNLTSATCSNVSCHFEKKTPVWGSTAYVAPADCGACHGAPPAGGASGTAGSHARHDAYYPGAANCQKCHPGYAGFSHATSAGRPLRVQGYLRNPLNALEAGATYTGTGANYLPSKSGVQVFGTCTNLYCHSSGQNTTNGSGTGVTYKTALWGSAPLACAGCHVDEATDATGTGSHKVHTISTGGNYDCVRCHLGYTRTTITAATHVNGLIELGAAGFTYSQGGGATHPAANSFGTCSATNCHGQGAPTWGATSAAPVKGFPYSATQCAKCHGSAATNPFYSTAIPKVTLNTDAKVGAHTDHLFGTRNISSAIACPECHTVPATVAAAGHMNGTALVAYNGPLAKANTTNATSCATTWCHGGNTTLIPQNSPARTTPAWGTRFPTTSTLGTGGTGTSGSGYCAQCHGYPPRNATHAGKTASSCTGCHPHINADGLTFNDKTKHVNGIIEAAGGHAVPYYNHQSAGTGTGCTGCHVIGTATSVYPAAVLGNAPDCRSCHKKAAPGIGCGSCHGAANGKPTGTTFPDRLGYHGGASDGAHNNTTCTKCHAGGGTGSGVNHGPGNRGANPYVVGPMVTGITPTNGAKGVPNSPVTCNHNSISGCSGGGTKTGW